MPDDLDLDRLRSWAKRRFGVAVGEDHIDSPQVSPPGCPWCWPSTAHCTALALLDLIDSLATERDRLEAENAMLSARLNAFLDSLRALRTAPPIPDAGRRGD